MDRMSTVLLTLCLLVPVNASAQAPWSSAEVQTTLRSDHIALIGALDEPTCKVFGELTAAVLDESARVFVLDAQSRRVSVFDTQGNCSWHFGREGVGPGEFQAPSAISIAGGRVSVLDRDRDRLEQFDVGTEGGVTGSIPLQVDPMGFCWSGDRLFVAGTANNAVVHELDASGSVLNSFGTLYDGDDGIVASISRPGFILCDPANERLVVAAWQVPEVRSFSLDGAMLWRSEIPGFLPPELIRSGPRVVGFKPSEEGLTYTATLLAISEGEALLQIGTPTYTSFRDMKSFVLDLATGGLRPIPDLPRVLALQGDLILAESTAEYPMLAIYRRATR